MKALNLLALPHHGRVRQTKHKLRRRGEGNFHYTQVRQGWVCHYSSDEPQVARPEWLLDQLIAQHIVTSDESFVLVEIAQFDNAYLCMVVEQGVVTQVWQQTDTNWLSLQINSGERTLLLGEVPGLDGEVHQLDSNATNTLTQYQLKAPSRLGVSIAATVVLIGAAVLIGKLWHRDASIEEVGTASPTLSTPEITLPSFSNTPWAQYRLALLDAASAEQAYQQAFFLAVYLSMLPDGWRPGDIQYDGSSIRSSAERMPHGLVSVLGSWVKKHPEMQRFAMNEHEFYAIQIPVLKGMPQWYTQSMPIEPSWQSLQDAATLMGFTLDAPVKEAHSDTWQRVSWAVSKPNASLGELAYLNDLLIKLPVSVSDLTFVHSADDIWSVSFTMTLYGGL